MALIDGDPVAALATARAAIDRAFDPVPVERERRTGWKKAMDERLRRLAVKIAPTMPQTQTQPWREVMVDALSDLPAMIALTAAKRALHRPMSFLNEVEGVVRELAAVVVKEQQRAKDRLDDLSRALTKPAVPALPPQDEGAPFSADEIRKMPVEIRDMGIAGGWITQAQVDDALGGDQAEAA